MTIDLSKLSEVPREHLEEWFRYTWSHAAFKVEGPLADKLSAALTPKLTNMTIDKAPELERELAQFQKTSFAMREALEDRVAALERELAAERERVRELEANQCTAEERAVLALADEWDRKHPPRVGIHIPVVLRQLRAAVEARRAKEKA